MNNLPPPPPRPEFLTFRERNARDIQRATQQLREMPENLLEVCFQNFIFGVRY